MTTETIRGMVLAHGRVAGSLLVLERAVEAALLQQSDSSAWTRDLEAERFEEAVSSLVRKYQQTATELKKKAKPEEAEIVRIQAELASDKGFHSRVRKALEHPGTTAEQAVTRVAEEIGKALRDSGNPIIAERAADIQDLSWQIHRWLRGGPSSLSTSIPADIKRPVIAVDELYPSMILEGRDLGVQAFVVGTGTKFAHAVILAGSFGIPILRVGSIDELIPYHRAPVVIDAEGAGEILINPDPREIPPQENPQPDTSEEVPLLPLQLWVNIATPDEIQNATWGGASGVGLYRTETLLMAGRAAPPTEDEQYQVYRSLFESCGGRPVTVRCFDVGGDKPVDFMAFGHNDNPQLGLRSLRLFRYHPELFTGQIRALARAAQGYPNFRLLYPMVETPEEWHFANELTDRALSELPDNFGSFKRGFMIETPSALWCLDELFSGADFASIGTNDLIQFLFGVDRSNPDVGSYYRPEHPAFLRVLAHIVAKAKEVGKPLILCGEVAHDPLLLPILVGLGIRHLSVPFPALAGVANEAAGLDVAACEDLAGACLRAVDRRGVLAILTEWNGEERERATPQNALHIDPVCGMSIDPASTPFFLNEKGRRVYFCSAECREKYRQGEG